MSHAQQTVTVDHPIEHVFAFLSDGLNNPKWRPEISETHLVSGEGLGAEYAVSRKGVGGLSVAADYRITRFEAPTRLDFEVIDGPARPHGSFQLKELSPTSTEVTYILDNEATGLMWITTPIISAELKTETGHLLDLPKAMAS